MAYPIFLTITALLMLPAFWFVFVPLMPALPYLFLVSIIFGFFDGFTHVTASNYWILGAVVVLSILVDYFSGILGARYGGASRQALIAGLFGLFVGTLLAPPLGGLVGLFIAVLLAELAAGVSERRALRAAAGAIVGSIIGVAANVFLAALFFVLFLLFAAF